MAKKNSDIDVEEVEEFEDSEIEIDEDEIDEEDLDVALEEDLEEDLTEDIEEFDDEIDSNEYDGEDDEDEEDDEDQDEETTEALEELETQELQLLDEEKNDNLLVDEVEVLRSIRREELTMSVDAQLQRPDEFVCQSCFMVKRTSQLANKRKQLCADCAE